MSNVRKTVYEKRFYYFSRLVRRFARPAFYTSLILVFTNCSTSIFGKCMYVWYIMLIVFNTHLVHICGDVFVDAHMEIIAQQVFAFKYMNRTHMEHCAGLTKNRYRSAETFAIHWHTKKKTTTKATKFRRAMYLH